MFGFQYIEEFVYKYLREKIGEEKSAKCVQLLNVILRIFLLILYFMIGVIFYSYNENWSLTNCVYFTVVTITTG